MRLTRNHLTQCQISFMCATYVFSVKNDTLTKRSDCNYWNIKGIKIAQS